MGVDLAGRILAAQKLALALRLNTEPDVHNVLLAQPPLHTAAAGVETNSHLGDTVVAAYKGRAVGEEETKVVEREAVRAKVGDEPAVAGVHTQGFTFFNADTGDGVDDIACVGLTGLVFNRALARG